MQAANEGSQQGDPRDQTRSVGIRVALSHERESNPFVEEVYHHRSFFSRLHHFVRVSNGYVVMPGGIGTTLELLMVWQLLQVRHLNEVPLILVGPMWRDLVDWAHHCMTESAPPFVGPGDVGIPHLDSVDFMSGS
jgi:predicted Rossmann-fold nucleotide-binding protein